jgi:hypothetical protein
METLCIEHKCPHGKDANEGKIQEKILEIAGKIAQELNVTVKC